MLKYIFTENTPEIDRMLEEDDKLFKQEVVNKINEIIREINIMTIQQKSRWPYKKKRFRKRY